MSNLALHRPLPGLVHSNYIYNLNILSPASADPSRRNTTTNPSPIHRLEFKNINGHDDVYYVSISFLSPSSLAQTTIINICSSPHASKARTKSTPAKKEVLSPSQITPKKINPKAEIAAKNKKIQIEKKKTLVFCTVGCQMPHSNGQLRRMLPAPNRNNRSEEGNNKLTWAGWSIFRYRRKRTSNTP